MKTMFQYLNEKQIDINHRGIKYQELLLSYALEPLGEDIEQ